MVVRDFDHQLGTQRLPGQVLALAPAALATRHAMLGFADCGSRLGPVLPRMGGEGVLAVGTEVFRELPAVHLREARADADVLKRAGVVEKAEQK